MAKLTVITDAKNNIVGTLVADAVDIGDGTTVKFALVAQEGHRHDIVEVADHVLTLPPDELHKEVAQHVKGAH